MNALVSLILLIVPFAALADLPNPPPLPSYYLCTSAHGLSDAPANVMVMASPMGITGLFNAANLNPPRVFFNAAFVAKESIQHPVYGVVYQESFAQINYDESHHGTFPIFTAAKVYFFKSNGTNDDGKMAAVEFIRDSGSVAYENCIQQSNR